MDRLDSLLLLLCYSNTLMLHMSNVTAKRYTQKFLCRLFGGGGFNPLNPPLNTGLIQGENVTSSLTKVQYCTGSVNRGHCSLLTVFHIILQFFT